jgi:prepilin peptidase CpaA
VLLALPYIALWVLGKGGAGDAKLMAAIGAWLSLPEGLVVLCCVATTGMILALLTMAGRRARQSPPWNLLTSLCLFAAAWGSGARGGAFLPRDDQEQAGRLTLPYGMAIFIGVCAGAVGVKLWIG